MDGIRLNGVGLFLGHLPNKKLLCFYFEKDNCVYPVAYISEKLEKEAIECWGEFIGDKRSEGRNDG